MSDTGNRSVGRTLTILEVLGATARPLTLTEVARAAELDVSTAYRLLRVLCRRAFVHRTEATRCYSLSLNSFRLGASDVVVQSVGRVAQIHLLRLASDVGETVRLAVLEGSDVRFCAEAGVYERPGSRMLGALMDEHASAAGKVLLAWRNSSEIEPLYRGKPLRSYTGRTIRSVASLQVELAKVRAGGYAVCHGESLLTEIRSIAGPCRDADGQVPFAVVISGPAARLPPERDAEVLPKLLATAHDLSEALGLMRTEVAVRPAARRRTAPGQKEEGPRQQSQSTLPPPRPLS